MISVLLYIRLKDLQSSLSWFWRWPDLNSLI